MSDMDLAPLDKTMTGIDKARRQTDGGKYSGANQALKSVRDGPRRDAEDFTAPPKSCDNRLIKNAERAIYAIGIKGQGLCPSTP
jgi:hypothetical protein